MHITFTSAFIPAIGQTITYDGVRYRVVNVEGVERHPRAFVMDGALAKRITVRVVFA